MKWQKDEVDSVLVRELAEDCKISLLEATVLVRRGIARKKDILFFLEQDFVYLHNPFCFKEMEIVIDRIREAIEEKEKVMVYGDKDVDGMTSASILVRSLQEHSIDSYWRVPTGNESYGLSKDDIDYAHSLGVSLVITVDCGISNTEEAEYANSLNIEMIVIDHHTPTKDMPDVLAIINPKVHTESYPFKSLCAAALAQKFRQALAMSETSLYNNDYVLLNVVPLNKCLKINMICLRNLVVQWEKELLISEDDASYQLETFVDILSGTQPIVYKLDQQQKLLQQVFKSLDFYALDLHDHVVKYFPSFKEKSLLQIGSVARLIRYLDEGLSEIAILKHLYVSVIHKEYYQIKESFLDVSEHVAIATIADMMPLVGENRILYKLGVQKMMSSPDPNIKTLLDVLKINSAKEIDSQIIGWNIAPIINSAGRLGEANVGVELFLAEDSDKALECAQKLLQLNQSRRKMMDSLRAQIKQEVEKSYDHYKRFVIVYNEDLPSNFTGTVAGQYSRIYGVPVVIIAKKSEGILNGSIRCPPHFDAPSIIRTLQEYLLDGGGHKAAAGFSFRSEHKDTIVAELARMFELGHELSQSGSSNFIVDVEMPTHLFVPDDLKKLLQRFEPYGEGWQKIHILFPNTNVYSCEYVGKSSEHLKLIVTLGKYSVPVFVWKFEELEIAEEEFKSMRTINLLATIKLGSFQGLDQFSLIMQDCEIIS